MKVGRCLGGRDWWVRCVGCRSSGACVGICKGDESGKWLVYRYRVLVEGSKNHRKTKTIRYLVSCYPNNKSTLLSI